MKQSPKKKSDKEFKVEILPIDTLLPHPDNYKIHTEEQLAHLEHSVKLYGFYKNIIISKDTVILAGHGIIQAAKRVGYKSAPVLRVPFLSTSKEAKRILVGDNETPLLAQVDDRLLTDMLQELKVSDMLIGTGYDELMLAARLFVTRNEKEIPNFDAAREWVGMPEYESGKADIRLIISFESEAYREEFVKKTKLKVSGSNRTTKTAWYPAKDRKDISSVKFENA